MTLPDGFAVGHWTDEQARTGCTVVLAPPGTRGAVEVRGGGTGSRELEALSPHANSEGPTAVLLTGGSAFGLAAADGVVRWLEQRGLGRPTPVGVIPLVPAAVVFDLAEGAPGRRPGPDEGYAACEAAAGGVPVRGRVGAGTGTAVGKVLGRERATPGGVGYAAARLAGGETVAAIAVANAYGDVIGDDGAVLGGPHDDRGELLRSADLIPETTELPSWAVPPGQSTTLVCVCTDAALDKRGCGIVARIATAGIARAVDPVFTPVDGDVVFCLASGPAAPPPGPAASWALLRLGTVAATVTAAAIRDAVREAA
jgi:L-aminopeptidase/D-esterase-like protein